jgi:CO dehydrogenase maturation factor
MLIVVEPSSSSIETARRIHRLAAELGVPKIYVVLNKVTDDSERRLVEEALKNLEIISSLPYDNKIKNNSLLGNNFTLTDKLRPEFGRIIQRLTDKD